MHNHSYENERMSTKTRYEEGAKGNSEMAYYVKGAVIHELIYFRRKGNLINELKVS